MKTIESYPAKLVKDNDGRYLVTFPDLPEALTDGETIEEAMIEATDCLEEAIAGRINRNETIPEPSVRKGRMKNVDLSAQFVMKVLVHVAFQEAGITQTELANRIKTDTKEARRILDPHYGSKLPKMEQALKALGYKVQVGISKAI